MEINAEAMQASIALIKIWRDDKVGGFGGVELNPGFYLSGELCGSYFA